MAIKEFTTSAVASVDEDEGAVGSEVTVKVDGREVTFYPPTSGQLAVTLAGSGDMATEMEQAAATINFFFSLLEHRDATFFRKRLFDRDDGFDMDTIADLVSYLLEEWSARPTKQPSDFLPSQRTAGQRSTAKQRHVASHRSPSARTASST